MEFVLEQKNPAHPRSVSRFWDFVFWWRVLKAGYGVHGQQLWILTWVVSWEPGSLGSYELQGKLLCCFWDKCQRSVFVSVSSRASLWGWTWWSLKECLPDLTCYHSKSLPSIVNPITSKFILEKLLALEKGGEFAQMKCKSFIEYTCRVIANLNFW